MRIFDLYSKVASLPDGEYFFVNKNFFSWKICVIKKDFESYRHFYDEIIETSTRAQKN